MLPTRNEKVINTNWDKIVISISGGKDSSVLMQYAIENFPKDKLICVHSLIDIDWKETIGIVEAQCKHFDLPLVKVQAVDKFGKIKGFLDQLTAKRVNRKTGDIGQYKFPDMSNRWCTSILKTGPIDKYCRKLKGNVLVLIGERAEESSNRAKLESYRPDTKNSLKNGTRTIVKYSPLLPMLESEVWAIINENNLPVHPCYSWGASRASCAICIFSSNREIMIANDKAPEIVAKYIEAERQIDHTFKYKPATKKRPIEKLTIEQIIEQETFKKGAQQWE